MSDHSLAAGGRHVVVPAPSHPELETPTVRLASVAQRRIDETLNQHRPLTIVRAPYGYGKTGLVAQWVSEQQAEGVSTGWFSLPQSGKSVRSYIPPAAWRSTPCVELLVDDNVSARLLHGLIQMMLSERGVDAVAELSAMEYQLFTRCGTGEFSASPTDEVIQGSVAGVRSDDDVASLGRDELPRALQSFGGSSTSNEHDEILQILGGVSGGPVTAGSATSHPLMLQEDAQILLDVLRRQASKVPDRTVVVLDGYVDDTVPTSLLPEIIRVLTDASPICQLVVMTREVTHLETFGAVFIDSLLVMPQALRATAGDVVEFGARRGVDLSSEQGEEIVRLTGGWPAMAAMVALQARRDSRGEWFFDDVAGIFEHEVSQLRDSLKLRVILASMFLPVLTPVLVDRILGEFGERISTLLTSLGVRVVPDSSRWVHGRSERDVTRALEHLVEDGYLRVLDEEAETRAYVRVPVIDQVTKRWFAQVDVAFSGPLVELTCQVMVGQGLALEAAEQCVDHSRWEGFASFVDDNWYELLEADPTRLLTVLAKVPLSVGEASDKLSIINQFLDAERRAQAARPGGVLARLGVQGRAQEEGGRHLLQGLVDASDAEQVRQWTIPMLEWGASLILHGDPAQAARALACARFLAQSHGASADVMRAVDVYSALVFAFDGELVTARNVLAGVDTPGDSSLLDHAYWSTLSLVSLGSLTQCPEPHGDVADPAPLLGSVDPLFLARYLLHIRCHIAAQELDQVLVRLADLRERCTTLCNFPLVRSLMCDATVHTYLALGDHRAAQERLDIARPLDPMAREMAARIAFQAGDLERAERLADDGLLVTSRSLRFTAAYLALKASVCASQERWAECSAVLREYVRVCAPQEMWGYLATMPQEVVTECLERFPFVADACPALAAVGGMYPAPNVRVLLSHREQEVLAAVAQHQSLGGASRALYVGVNTVKTHLTSVYRKLGVHSYAEAVVRARELGVLS